jgi:4a-hydroxytetrahydrobiopterin dehydratase
MAELCTKRCVPCEGGVQPLTEEGARALLGSVPGWSLRWESPPRIMRDFEFTDFQEALAFVNRVGEIAEAEGHHPNILMYSWNRVALDLYTHAIDGLHENDFILAAKVNELSPAG